MAVKIMSVPPVKADQELFFNSFANEAFYLRFAFQDLNDVTVNSQIAVAQQIIHASFDS